MKRQLCFSATSRISTLAVIKVAVLAGSLALQSHADPVFDLTAIDGNNGVRIGGIAAGDNLSRATSGDLDGNGVADVILPLHTVNNFTGAVYVVYGDTLLGAGATFSLGTLNGTNGFRIDGVAAGDRLGWSAATGDFNNDNVDDLIIGARTANGNLGAVYGIFGGQSFPATVDLSTIGTPGNPDGFVIDGVETGGQLGHSVASTDFNRDGVDDLVLGAPGVNSLAGEVYVVYGATGFSPPADISTLDGTNGVTIGGAVAGTAAGLTASGLGDVNDDNASDLILGASLADINGNNSGAAYVVFGSTTPPASIDLSSLNGGNGFVVPGLAADDTLGTSVSDLDDFNNDGIADLILGAPGVDSQRGAAYVIFGRGTFPATLDLASLDGSNGFMINGATILDATGVAVGNPGDFNNDGLGDLLVGAIRGDRNGEFNVGEAYVLYGNTIADFPATLELSTLTNDIGSIVRGEEAQDVAGGNLSGLADLNGDGLDEILIGASQANVNGDNSGAVYLVYGATTELDLDKSGTPGPIIPSDSITYTFGITNTGPDTAYGTRIVDDLAVGTSFNSFSGTNWSCQNSGGLLVCDYAVPLTPGNSTATLTVNVNTGGGIESIVRNDATALSAWFDPGFQNRAFAETETEAVIFRDQFE